MSYVSSNNIRALLSVGDEQSTATGTYNVLYATDFSASNTTQLQRVRRIGPEVDYYIQTGPKSASINVTAIPATGASENQLMTFLQLTGDFVSGSFIQVPSYRFEKCFLKSLSFNLEPWKPLDVNLQFDSYGLSTGPGITSLDIQDTSKMIISPLRNMTVTISAPSFTQTISEFESLSFSVEVDREPNTELGDAYPKKVSVARIAKSLQINGASNLDWLSDYEPNTVVTTTVTMADGNSFSVDGVLSSQSVSISANGAAKGGLQVVEEMV